MNAVVMRDKNDKFALDLPLRIPDGDQIRRSPAIEHLRSYRIRLNAASGSSVQRTTVQIIPPERMKKTGIGRHPRFRLPGWASETEMP